MHQFNQQSKINDAEYAATVAEKENKRKYEAMLQTRKKELQNQLKPSQKAIAQLVEELERAEYQK